MENLYIHKENIKTYIKDFLEDYSVNPQVKKVSNEVNETLDRLTDTIKSNNITPSFVINNYISLLKVHNKYFKELVLNNKNNKTGLLISQCDNYSLDDYIKDKYNITITRNNLLIDYRLENLLDLCKMEITLIFNVYGTIYDFQLRYIIYVLLLTKFKSYGVYFDNTQFWNVRAEDFNQIYNALLNTKVKELPNIGDKAFNTIIKNKNKKEEQSKLNKLSHPQCAEDLTCLFTENMTQHEKCLAIMRAWPKCGSEPTARRWMKKFNLLKKSTLEIHLENTQNNIIEEVKDAKEEMITISKVYFETILAEIKELRKENAELKEKLTRIEQNQQTIMSSTTKVEDALGDTSFLNNFKIK